MTHARSFRTPTTGRVAALSTLAAVLLAFGLASTAGASDSSLRVTLNSWSRKIGADAHSVALAAQLRHPRRMTESALRFRNDSLRAHTAIAAQRPSTARGHSAQRLALTAFTDYAVAGSRWAASGRARLQGQKTDASRYASAAATYAHTGERLLVSAGKLLR